MIAQTISKLLKYFILLSSLQLTSHGIWFIRRAHSPNWSIWSDTSRTGQVRHSRRGARIDSLLLNWMTELIEWWRCKFLFLSPANYQPLLLLRIAEILWIGDWEVQIPVAGLFFLRRCIRLTSEPGWYTLWPVVGWHPGHLALAARNAPKWIHRPSSASAQEGFPICPVPIGWLWFRGKRRRDHLNTVTVGVSQG